MPDNIIHVINDPATQAAAQAAAQGAAEALAKQQLTTAWIQAGAAIVQAIGSVGAIWASVWIARTADKRASAAEVAAEKRAKAADDEAQRRIALAETLATARAERAEQTADYRMQMERIQPHNDLVRLIVARVDLAIAEIDAQILKYAAERDASKYMRVISGKVSQSMAVDLLDWRERTHNAHLIEQIDGLSHLFPTSTGIMFPSEMVIWLTPILASIRAKRDDIEATLKPEPSRPFAG